MSADKTTPQQTPASVLLGAIKALRAHQWTKNALLFAALVFSVQFLDTVAVIKAFTGFVAFCALSSSGYILNDYLDREADRKHPKKSKRPIASGALPEPLALVEFLLLLGIGIFLAWSLSTLFLVLSLAYLTTTLTYSFFFKHVVILDVMFIAMGFVWRALAGAAAIQVEISAWFFLCTAFLSLFLGFAKRSGELRDLGDKMGTRKILREYSVNLLNQYQGIVMGNIVLTYSLYAALPSEFGGGPTPWMVLTVPHVIYGVFRFLYLAETRGEGAAPDETLLKDWQMLFTVGTYGLLTMGLLFANQAGMLPNAFHP